MNASFDCAGKRYNVMVFYAGRNHDKQLNGLKFQGIAKTESGVPPFVGTHSYNVWIFEDGFFRNRSDGGWINWGFRGWFDRDGSYVSFRNPYGRLDASQQQAAGTEEAQQIEQPDEEVLQGQAKPQ